MIESRRNLFFLKGILARRFILYILLFSSIIILLATSLELYLDYNKNKAQVERTLDQIRTSRLQSIVNNVWVADQELINLQLREILALPDIQYVEIISGNKEKTYVGTRKTNKNLSRTYPLIYSFRNREINLGSLNIEATMDNTYQQISKHALFTLLTLGVEIFLFSLFIFYVFYQLVGRHLLTMADYARGLEPDTLGTPLCLSRTERGQNDELDMVVSSLNQMRISILEDMARREKTEEEKRKLEEQLRQSHKMEAIGTMAGGIAHDFNNILAIILGNTELAVDDIPPGNPARQNIEEVLNASIRARDLVKQILAFSRKEKQELISIRPQLMINETLKLLRSTTPTTISIVQEISPDCGMIMADPTQLHQLVMNLFTNGVHAMDEKGELTVSLHEVDVSREFLDKTPLVSTFAQKNPGAYARLSVTDQGTGMTRETIERIFDPFYTTKEVGKGTGMGLSVVHGIVESHNGFITVESEVGRDSTFTIFFPITHVDEEELKGTATSHHRTGTERILVVDDEEALLKMAKRMLDDLGYKVTTENSSVKALEVFNADPTQFDLIITDQSMPDMSGMDLTAEIRKTRPDIPIILCTGYSTKVSAENAGEKGIRKYISKPYTKTVLSEAVREVLDEQLI